MPDCVYDRMGCIWQIPGKKLFERQKRGRGGENMIAQTSQKLGSDEWWYYGEKPGKSWHSKSKLNGWKRQKN